MGTDTTSCERFRNWCVCSSTWARRLSLTVHRPVCGTVCGALDSAVQRHPDRPVADPRAGLDSEAPNGNQVAKYDPVSSATTSIADMIGRIDEVVVDCASPRVLAPFWSAVLGGAPCARDESWHDVEDDREPLIAQPAVHRVNMPLRERGPVM